MIIDGFSEAAKIRAQLREEVANSGLKPGLAVIQIGDHLPSQIYVRHKIKACQEVGFHSQDFALPATTPISEVQTLIHELNQDPHVHGILLQLPLPNGWDADALINAIDPAKDVDGLTYYNQGALVANKPKLIPCTPQGVMHLIRLVQPNLEGLSAVVVGRSTLVGKPTATLLTHANATVTLAHSKSRDLATITSQADILVTAIGHPYLIGPEAIKPGAIVIDVGIARNTDGTLCGDVQTQAVLPKVRAISPVPRGVGPMTIAYLLRNTFLAAQMAT